jgi:hypothetical protein
LKPQKKCPRHADINCNRGCDAKNVDVLMKTTKQILEELWSKFNSEKNPAKRKNLAKKIEYVEKVLGLRPTGNLP